MVISKSKITQSSIESRLQTPLTITLKKDDTFRRVFGHLEEWVFNEGGFRFMLNPINRRWLFWNRFHDDWKDTGYYAGEVEFVWDGKKLLTKEENDPKRSFDPESIAEMLSVDDPDQKYTIFANTLIGNERNCDIKIEDSNVKALILQHAGGFTFFTLGKKDTTFVNNNIVPQEGILLEDGDKLVLGKTELIFKKISQPKQETFVKQFCPYCGAKIKEDQKFCTSCEKKLQ